MKCGLRFGRTRFGNYSYARTKERMLKVKFQTIAAAFLLAFLAFAANEARAQVKIDEYDFQLMRDSFHQGEDIIIAVKLVHKPTGKPVSDAVIFAQRMDMEPDGMPTMTAELSREASTESGVYQFRTTLPMEGAWRLSLAAKVQGATGTLQKRLVLKAQN